MELNSFLKELGIKAKKESQKIVVIRNHQLLPDKNIGRDLDLIIKEDSEEIWINILKKICQDNHLQIQSNHSQFYCKGFKIKGVNDKNNYLYLDLNSRFNWRGIDFYSTDLLVKQSITFKDQIYTGKKNYINWYITFCHSFLYGGFINKKYLKEYRQAILENYIEFQKLFKIIFTNKQTEYLFKKILSSDVQISRLDSYLFRLNILLRIFLKKPIYTFYHLVKSYLYDLF